MSKKIFQIYSLLMYNVCCQLYHCSALSAESSCLNLLANVEASLTTTLDFIKLAKESQSSQSCAVNKEDKDSDNANISHTFHSQSSNCAELYNQGNRKSGIYDVYPKGRPISSSFQVYCDMEKNGGGWTIIQRRDDFGEPRENFFRKWNDYKNGFGDLNKEFWLGNDHISVLTMQDQMTLLVNLEDFNKTSKFAEFSDFKVEGEADDYRMNFSKYSGNAGDSLSRSRGSTFATIDKDQSNCSSMFEGGWWYYKTSDCFRTNLNGIYRTEPLVSSYCPNWYTLKNEYRCLKRVEMKLRPEYFAAVN